MSYLCVYEIGEGSASLVVAFDPRERPRPDERHAGIDRLGDRVRGQRRLGALAGGTDASKGHARYGAREEPVSRDVAHSHNPQGVSP